MCQYAHVMQSVIRVSVLFGMLIFVNNSLADSTDHRLLLETGRHTANVTDIGSNRDGSIFATSSKDKTVRIWNAAGRQLQVIRPPIDKMNGNGVLSVAISADASFIAYVYSTQMTREDNRVITIFPIQIYHRPTNRIVRTIIRYSFGNLAFSHNGKYLAWSGESIEVYRTTDWSLYATTSLKKNTPNSDSARWNFAAFSSDGTHIASSAGDEVIFFSIRGSDYNKAELFDSSKCTNNAESSLCRLLVEGFAASTRINVAKRVQAKHGSRPAYLEYSPDGKSLAFGYYDSASVTVINTKKFSQVELPAIDLETSFINGPNSMLALAWSKNGNYLYSAGTMGNGILNPTVIRKWDLRHKATYSDIPTSDSLPLDIHRIVTTSDGLAFVSRDNIGILTERNIRLIQPISGIRGYNPPQLSFDGTTIVFYFENSKSILGDKYRFDVARRILVEEPDGAQPGIFDGIDETPGMQNSGLMSESPVLNGVRLEIDSRSGGYTFAPDGESMVLGTSASLYRFNRTGQQLWRVSIPERVAGLNLSRDGQFVVAALHDGTMRWYRFLDGKELLAFYVLNDRRNWVLWSPENKYDASNGGHSLVIMAHELGAESLLGVQQVGTRSEYYRPSEVTKALQRVQIEEAFPFPENAGDTSKKSIEF